MAAVALPPHPSTSKLPASSSSSSSFKNKLVDPFVNRALLTLDHISVSSPTPTGFTIDVKISLTRCSPMTAQVDFIKGFQLWSSKSGTVGGTDEVMVAVASSDSTRGSVSCREGSGKGDLRGSLELCGQDGAEWIDRIVHTKGPVPTSIVAPISVKIKAAHMRCPSYLLRRSFSVDGLGGFDGACSPDSSIALSNVQAAPMSTNKDGIALYADLPLHNPSKQLSLSLGRIVCTMEKRDKLGQSVGTATIEAFDLAPLATPALRVRIVFHYGAIAEAAGSSLFGFIIRDSRLSGLQLVIKGEHKQIATGDLVEASWLRDMLDRIPIYISFADTLKIVQGVTFGSSWL